MESGYKPADILVYKNPSEMIKAFPEPLVHYENDGVILLEDCGLEFDESYISVITFPPEWKKIGTTEHITDTPIILRGHVSQNAESALRTDRGRSSAPENIFGISAN